MGRETTASARHMLPVMLSFHVGHHVHVCRDVDAYTVALNRSAGVVGFRLSPERELYDERPHELRDIPCLMTHQNGWFRGVFAASGRWLPACHPAPDLRNRRCFS